ncbi:hypothetical protein EMCRGX_G033041 [Ephydatia muelleri]
MARLRGVEMENPIVNEDRKLLEKGGTVTAGELGALATDATLTVSDPAPPRKKFLRSLDRVFTKHVLRFLAELGGEFIGTFVLTLIATTVGASDILLNTEVGLWNVAFVTGMGVGISIYSTAYFSNSHLNPAVTLAFAVLFAAFLGGVVLYAAYWDSIQLYEEENGIVRGQNNSIVTAAIFGAYFPNPSYALYAENHYDVVSPVKALAVEAWATGILVFMIFTFSDPNNSSVGRVDRKNKSAVPVLIGLTVAVLISLYAPLTQAGLNPAKVLGPRILAAMLGWGSIAIPGPRKGFWVYIIGPLIGGPIGAALQILFPCFVLRDVTVAMREVAVAMREVAVAMREVAVAMREVAVATREVAVAMREVAVAMREVAVAMREVAVAMREVAVAMREVTVAIYVIIPKNCFFHREKFRIPKHQSTLALLFTLEEIGSIDPQVALALLHLCSGFCKLIHIANVTPPHLILNAMQSYDTDIHCSFANCTGLDTSDTAWKQAKTSLSRGGLGLRLLADHFSAAYIASFCTDCDTLSVSSLKDNSPNPKKLSDSIEELHFNSLLGTSSTADRGRLLSISFPHASAEFRWEFDGLPSLSRAGLSSHLEVGRGWGQDCSRTHPVDILFTNWDNGISAAFDVTVTSPLISSVVMEVGMYSGVAARAAEFRKLLKMTQNVFH